MITYETMRHKLNLLSDQMLDTAEDMQLCEHLFPVAIQLIAQAECISNLADSLKIHNQCGANYGD